ncbi:MAG: hypothetical protein AAF208_06460 [Cyanobacteria bacterium P01_A01_bin.45]
MGRWTPLVLMAGGLAILLGTLLGISFPMGGENANVPNSRGKSSSVLPANINVNSTAADSGNSNVSNDSNNNRSVAQNRGAGNTPEVVNPETSGTPNQSPATPSSTNNQQSSEPIRALW